MAIISNMLLVLSGALFWLSTVYFVTTSSMPLKEGTLLWCKVNNKMDQPICAPYSVKDQIKLRRSQ